MKRVSFIIKKYHDSALAVGRHSEYLSHYAGFLEKMRFGISIFFSKLKLKMDELEKGTYSNATKEQLSAVYEFMQRIPNVTASEVTFTVAPSRCKDVQDIKKRIMTLVERRIKDTPGLVGFIITRENHKNGWPHVHGIVWYESDNNNAMQLGEGRVWSQLDGPDELSPNRKTRFGYKFNELGKSQLYPLRINEYEINNNKWKNWFEYILKDQEINYKIRNKYFIKDIKIDLYFEKIEIDAFVD